MISRLFSVLALLGLSACDPSVNKVIGHVCDSTGAQLQEELQAAASWRPVGDLIVPLACVPGYALGEQFGYFTGRLTSAYARIGLPDVMLIQLGTNDLRAGHDHQYSLMDTPEELDGVISSFLLSLPAGAPILWVMPGPGIAQERRTMLREALDRAPADITLLELPEALYGDGLHFSNDLEASQRIVEALDGMQP